jgi:hypothetical protein
MSARSATASFHMVHKDAVVYVLLTSLGCIGQANDLVKAARALRSVPVGSFRQSELERIV